MPTTKTIQVVLDAKLLQSADLLAKRQKVNRSALIRDALAKLVKEAHIRELEERERKGYAAIPDDLSEMIPEAFIAWPD